jgi:hypothetical protein
MLSDAKPDIQADTKPEAAAGDKPDAKPEASGLASKVLSMMADDFPPDKLAWIGKVQWTGPTEIPLDQVDFSQSAQWQAKKEPDKVDGFVDKIEADNRKPVVLLKGPDGGKYRVIDGHHRSLAYQKLGEPLTAYAGTTSDEAAFKQALDVHVAQYEDTKFQG